MKNPIYTCLNSECGQSFESAINGPMNCPFCNHNHIRWLNYPANKDEKTAAVTIRMK